MLGADAFALMIGIICATVMGFAINRGATCMVAAVEQAVRQRRPDRLIALAEASLWVAGGMALAGTIGLMPKPIVHHPISAMTIGGGALLGLGAYINKACVFGSVARFGSGEWHYAATPLGFLGGCVLILPWLHSDESSTVTQAPNFPAAIGIALALFAIWRGIGLLLAARSGALKEHIWSPHQATSVIGLTFVIMLLAVGAWTYPEALAQLARGMTMDSAIRIILFVALLAGAAWGGAARRREGTGGIWSVRGAVACFAGGALMGMGSLMIPGGNDNLILVGLPFLQPYAWVAIVAMACVIVASLLIEDRKQRVLD